MLNTQIQSYLYLLCVLLSFSAIRSLNIQSMNFTPSLNEKYVLKLFGRFKVNILFQQLYLQILNNTFHEGYIIQGWSGQTRWLKISASICIASLCLFVYGECTTFVSFIIWIFRPYLSGSENSISPLGVYSLLRNSNMLIRKQKI